ATGSAGQQPLQPRGARIVATHFARHVDGGRKGHRLAGIARNGGRGGDGARNGDAGAGGGGQLSAPPAPILRRDYFRPGKGLVKKQIPTEGSSVTYVATQGSVMQAGAQSGLIRHPHPPPPSPAP